MSFYPIFGIFVIFVAWFTYERKKHSRDIEKNTQEFWDRDAASNSVRKVNPDTLEYITIPLKNLPIGLCNDEQIVNFENTLKDLSTKRILNLTGMTSTDIKMKYGAANLSEVSSYDDNFTLMAQTVYSYGSRLYELGYTDEAITVLEFGIVSLTDISGNYKLLCQLYSETSQPERINFLRETAEKLDSLSKGTILRTIDKYSL